MTKLRLKTTSSINFRGLIMPRLTVPGKNENRHLIRESHSILCCRGLYINTLMIQQVLADRGWLERMAPDDLRALTPLIYAHINPYGRFELDMRKRLHLEA